MSNVTDVYGAGGGNFLKSADLDPANAAFFWIKTATVETKDFGKGEGPKSSIVLTFFETPENPLSTKKLSLNKTQATELQNKYGSYEGWAFKGFRAYQGKTSFQGQPTATITIMPLEVFIMEGEVLANAQRVLQQEQAQAAQAPAFSGPPAQPNASGGFQPPAGGFTPPSTTNNPSENW